MSGTQVPLSAFESETDVILYRKGCKKCCRVFFDQDPSASCPECGKEHPDHLGFRGDAEFAKKIEEADLPDYVDETRLDAVTAREVLCQIGVE